MISSRAVARRITPSRWTAPDPSTYPRGRTNAYSVWRLSGPTAGLAPASPDAPGSPWTEAPPRLIASGRAASVIACSALDHGLARQRGFLDLDPAGRGTALGQAQLRDHRVREVVADDLLAERVHHDRGAVSPVRIATHDRQVPVPQFRRAGEAALEGDRRRLRLARELADRDVARLVDVRVVHDLALAGHAGHRREVRDDAHAVDIEQYVALQQGIGCRH